MIPFSRICSSWSRYATSREEYGPIKLANDPIFLEMPPQILYLLPSSLICALKFCICSHRSLICPLEISICAYPSKTSLNFKSEDMRRAAYHPHLKKCASMFEDRLPATNYKVPNRRAISALKITYTSNRNPNQITFLPTIIERKVFHIILCSFNHLIGDG